MTFKKDTTKLDSIQVSERDINKLLETGKLFRYCDKDTEISHVYFLEKEFTKLFGTKYALAVNSCSSAMFLSMLSLGVKPGDPVLLPAFTFTAVPSTIIHAGATPILVEIDNNYSIDLNDLEKKIIETKAKVLLSSYMRGHFPNMDKLISICNKYNVNIIEDCANSLGSYWGNHKVGTFGKTGCFSFQSYKIFNGGEGGILITDDEDIIVKSVLYSGSYDKMWEKHPFLSYKFEKYQTTFPTYNMRLSNIQALIVRSQIPQLDDRIKKYNKRYLLLKEILKKNSYIYIPETNKKANKVFETMQFTLKSFTDEECKKFMQQIKENGIIIPIFGLEKNARYFKNWKYIKNIPDLPNTTNILERTADLRLPLSFSLENINELGETIINTINNIKLGK